MLRPGEIKISTVPHCFSSFYKFFCQFRIFPADMYRCSLSFYGFGIFMQQAGDVAEQFVEHIVFLFHQILSVPIS